MNRYTAGGLALVSVLSGKLAIACRLRRPPEGWRRTVGILLRFEPTRFAVSAFGLHVPGAVVSDSRQRIERVAAEALRRSLSQEHRMRTSVWNGCQRSPAVSDRGGGRRAARVRRRRPCFLVPSWLTAPRRR